MKEELFVIIDGERKQLDLNTPSGITLTYKSNLFGDLSQIEDNYSYEFTLPETSINRKMLENKNTRTIDAEFFINGVCIFKNCLLYIKKHETQEGYQVFLRVTLIDSLKKIRDRDVSIRDLGGTDYIKDDFGTEEADDIITDASCYNVFVGREPFPAIQNMFVQVEDEHLFPESYSEQCKKPYYRLLYGAGVGLRKDSTGTVIAKVKRKAGGGIIDSVVTPFYLFENKLLTPPPVASIPYLISKIADYFGINISSDSVGLEKFCLPFSRMGQTECLMRQNYITLPIKADVQSINIRYDSNNPDTWWWSFKKDSRTELYIHSLYYQKELEYKTKNTILKKTIKGSWWDNSNAISIWPRLFTYQGGMGKNSYVRGCIKIKYRVLDVPKSINSAPQLKIKSSLFSSPSSILSLYDAINISFERDTDSEYAKEFSVDGDFLDKSVSGIGNADNMKYSGTFTVVYEMRPEYGGKLVSLGENFWGQKALFLYVETGDYRFAVEEIDSMDLVVYSGDTELLSERNNSNSGCMNYYKNLPDITCVELLNNLSFASGAFLSFDYATNTLKFTRRNIVLEKTAVDWGDKIVFKHNFYDKKIEYSNSSFTGEIGKTTFFLMKNDEVDNFGNPQKDEIDKSYYKHSYGKMIFEGGDLPENVTYLNSVFSGALISWPHARAFDSGTTTDFWEIEAATFDGSTSSLLNVKTNEGSAFLGMFKSIYVKDYGYFGGISIWQFPSNMSESKEYMMLSRIWKAPYTIEEYMELSEFDLRDLDYTVPIYLHKYNAYFGIVAIERYDDGICKVIMFKLPMEKNYTIKYEPHIVIMPKHGGYVYDWEDEVWVSLRIRAYYYKQEDTTPFKSSYIDLREDDIKLTFDHKYGSEEWYWDKERNTIVLTANQSVQYSYHIQAYFEVTVNGEMLDLSSKAIMYDRQYNIHV